MNESAIKKMEIVNSLAHVPVDGLDQIKKYIDAILAESNGGALTGKSLKGIWKDKGFEKIIDLEGEIRVLRQDLDKSILSRNL